MMLLLTKDYIGIGCKTQRRMTQKKNKKNSFENTKIQKCISKNTYIYFPHTIIWAKVVNMYIILVSVKKLIRI